MADFEQTASEPRDCAEHVLSDADEIAAWLRLIHSCRLILEDVGYDVTMQGPVIHIEVPSTPQVADNEGPVLTEVEDEL